MELLFQLAPFVILILIGLVAGRMAEKKHFRSLDERESKNGGFVISQLRTFPGAVVGPAPPVLVASEVVIASDYLKTFLSGLRKIFGGEMLAYQSLLTRARREALQRVVEDARSRGYNAICNVRFDGADVAGSSKSRKRPPMVAIFATATAYHCAVG
jgi:uncharacterized protein YbjQ (UPF0145 family)